MTRHFTIATTAILKRLYSPPQPMVQKVRELLAGQGSTRS